MPSVTLSDLQARVYARVDNNTLLYPANRVTPVINEAIRILGVFCGLYQQTIQLVSQPGKIWYSIQGLGLVYPSRVQFNNTYLEPTSLLQLGRASSRWVTDTSLNALTPPSSWLPFGFNTFAIHPADSNGGNLLYVTGAAEPPLLVNPTDTINLNNSVFAAFDEYCVCVLQLKESPKTFTQAATNYQAFLRIIKEVTIYRSFIAPRFWISEAQQPQKRG